MLHLRLACTHFCDGEAETKILCVLKNSAYHINPKILCVLCVFFFAQAQHGFCGKTSELRKKVQIPIGSEILGQS
jgi:hypothetical protein